jgi:RNA 2',3'-cyclic 3'-phosphodiesterase
MRAFVAVEVPALRPSVGAGAPAPEHLTLRFLGDISAERVPPMVARLNEVARGRPAFELRIEGIGAFPSARAPRVVWFGATAGSEEVGRLARDVREALRGESTGAWEEPFVPHVTWFRVRSPTDHRAALDLLQGRRPLPAPRQFPVERFVLKQSVLSRGGAVHSTLASFPLDRTVSSFNAPRPLGNG